MPIDSGSNIPIEVRALAQVVTDGSIPHKSRAEAMKNVTISLSTGNEKRT